MRLTARKPKQSIPAPEGIHTAVCIGIYDLGMQYSERFNHKSRKVLFTWELPDHRMGDGRPMVISNFYTNSLHEKATLRKDLDTWRGKATDKDTIDLIDMLGKGCQIQVIHEQKNDRTVAKVNTVMPLPQGTNVQAESELNYFSFEAGQEISEKIPEWIRHIIEKSEEYREKTAAEIHHDGKE